MKKVRSLVLSLIMTAIFTVPVYAASISNVDIDADANGKVVITGDIDSGSGKGVTLRVKTPDGQIDHVNQVYSGVGGEFTFSFITSDNLEGKYVVEISGTNVDAVYKDEFTLADDGNGDTGNGGSGNTGGGSTGGNTGGSNGGSSGGSSSGGSRGGSSGAVSTNPTTANPTNLENAIKNSSAKQVSVDIAKDATVVKNNIFESLKGQDKTVTFVNKSSNGSELYSWTFNGKDINREVAAVDLIVNFTSAKADTIKNLSKNSSPMIISFAHDGNLPGKAEVKVKVDSAWLQGKDKEKLSFYYFNEEANRLELVAANLKADANGYIKFSIDHCSDYIVVDAVAAKVIDEDNSKYATGLVEEALKEKTFYHYNVAYYQASILGIETDKNTLLNKLSAISGQVWNEDIKYINSELDKLVSTASGKIYDEIQVKIEATNLNYIDKAYLMGEVTSWGKKLVWTKDYAEAVGTILNAWTSTTMDNINKADAAVSKVKNEYSKQYLSEELAKIRKKYLGL